ncbi:MAG: hypothetical protein RIS70_2125 [Planctomycetota bacterium]
MVVIPTLCALMIASAAQAPSGADSSLSAWNGEDEIVGEQGPGDRLHPGGFDPGVYDPGVHDPGVHDPGGYTNLPVGYEAVEVPLADGSVQPLPEPWQVKATWLSAGSANGMGMTDVDLHRSWVIPLGDRMSPVMVTPGFTSHSWVGPAAIDLPPQLFDLYLDFSTRLLQRDHFELRGGVTPGLYGDFHRIDSKTLQWSGWLYADYQIGNHWTLAGGVAYVRQLKSSVLPVGGVVYDPGKVRLEFLFPKPRAILRMARDGAWDWQLFVTGGYGGGSWSVLLPDESNELLSYSDFRLSAGAEWWTRGRLSGSFECGYVFDRRLSAFGQDIFRPDDTFFLRAQIAY